MKKALLIGINDYPEGNELTGCIEDINSVKAAIERHGDGENVRQMDDETWC